ncbi:MAG TPA: Lrp/AsnC family transcriptional regulator [Chlamydiales bacterium]|nr:Lrp/AsnC family transcriptional regulator [Chlamydiales bacterium]
MDAIDKTIVSLLQAEGRTSCEKMSSIVGLSVSAVNERIKRLQKQGVITGWGANICPQKVGLDVLSFVQVLLGERCDEEEFLTEISKIPEILECHHITGEWSYLLKVRCRNISHFETVLGEKLKPIPGILRTHTLIALSSPLERTILPLESNEP